MTEVSGTQLDLEWSWKLNLKGEQHLAPRHRDQPYQSQGRYGFMMMYLDFAASRNGSHSVIHGKQLCGMGIPKEMLNCYHTPIVTNWCGISSISRFLEGEGQIPCKSTEKARAAGNFHLIWGREARKAWHQGVSNLDIGWDWYLQI